MNKIFLLVFMFSLIAMHVFAQNAATTESYGIQEMDVTIESNGDRTLITSDQRVMTYDYTGMADPGTAANFDSALIPVAASGIEWDNAIRPNTANMPVDPSIFQAHWLVPQVLEILESEFGFVFDKVHVAVNFDFEGAFFYEGNFNEAFIGFGRRNPDEDGTPSYAEADVIAHELGHSIIFELIPLDYSMPKETDAFEEGIADMFGMVVESEIDLPSPVGDNADVYMTGELVPIREPRDVSQLDGCFNTFNAFSGGEAMGHLLYLLVEGDFLIEPIGNLIEVFQFIFDAMREIDPLPGVEGFKEAILNHADLEFGECTKEYRSVERALSIITTGPEMLSQCADPIDFECCNTGPEVLSTDIVIDLDFEETFQFDGDIIIPSGVTLTINGGNSQSRVTFPNNAGITVQTGGQLIINGNFMEMTTCDPESGFWRGILLEDGARANIVGVQINQAATALSIRNVTNQDLIFDQLFIDNCGTGVNVFRNAAPNLLLDANDRSQITNCGTGILVSESHVNIEDWRIERCDNGVRIESSSVAEITGNRITNIVLTGIDVFSSTASIGSEQNRNIINAREGIRMFVSQGNIDDNIIDVTDTGINYSFGMGTENTISSNVITIDQARANDNLGIHSWFNSGLTITDNTILGAGQEVGIFLQDSESATASFNTVDIGNSGNGIAIESGFGNTINNNLMQDDADNGIGIFGSIDNDILDNDIAANNNGLLVGANLAEDQIIACNVFCEGDVDLNINSEIGLQSHHENTFRSSGSRAVASGLTFDNRLNYTFEHQIEDVDIATNCGLQKLFPKDDPLGIFITENGFSDEGCTDRAGADGIGPDIVCELVREASEDPDLYYARLRQILGRYFEEHGPNQLPDCISDCVPMEVIEFETELRAAFSSESSGLGESASNSYSLVRQVAETQYQALGGNKSIPPPTVEPCPEIIEDVELHRATYKSMVKQIAHGELDESELQSLRLVANLCIQDYGEVVSWARGLLAIHHDYSYSNDRCKEVVEERSRRPEQHTVLIMELSPQPADDYVLVHIEGITASNGTLDIRDMTGQLILSTDYEEGQQISTANMAQGVYLIQVISEGNVVISQKMIVTHE